MKINRERILTSFLETVEGISDKEYQKRVWIRGEGPECDDFTETVCHFLYEGGGILENYKEFGITEGQYSLLKAFRDDFEAFANDNHFPEIFIDTPEWEEIVQMAKEVLKAFNYQKGSK